MSTPTTAELLKRIGKLEHKQAALETCFGILAGQFGWYHHDANRKDFALVIRKVGENADLLILGDHVSGHITVKRNKQPINSDPEFPKDDRWEPMVTYDLETVANLFAQLGKTKEEANGSKSALKAKSGS